MQQSFLILSQVYPPDPAAVGQYFDEAARALRARGAKVRVLTANRGYDDPSARFPATADHDGVAVRRLPASSFGKACMPIRILGQLSFLKQCIVRGLFQRDLTDLLVSTSPPMCAFAALCIGWLRPSVRIHYWVMDLNPDQAVALGAFRPSHPLVRAMDWLNRRILKRADSIVALDRFMRDRLLAKTTPARAPITVIPPWPMAQHSADIASTDNPFRREHGLEDKFVVMFSGNHSWVHPLDTILEAALLVADDPRFVFLFIGGGKGKAAVESFIEKHRPSNIRALPYQALDQIKYSLAAADLHLVSLGENMSGIVHPCKLYGALAIGRPVLALGPSESYLSDILVPHQLGWNVAHGDTAGAVTALRAAIEMDKKTTTANQTRARSLIREQFSRDRLLNQFLDTIGDS